MAILRGLSWATKADFPLAIASEVSGVKENLFRGPGECVLSRLVFRKIYFRRLIETD